MPLWVSVGGFSVEDYAHVAERVGAREEVEALELNLSCPNVDEVPENVGEVVAAVRAVTAKPLYAKLSAAVADSARPRGRPRRPAPTGLSLVNTVSGLALDERTLQPVLARGGGRPLGPRAAADRPRRGLRLLPRDAPADRRHGRRSSRQRTRSSSLAAGASDVAVGTALFADPGAPTRIRAELEAEVAALGFASPDNVVGVAHASADSTLDPRSRVGAKKSLHIGANMAG